MIVTEFATLRKNKAWSLVEVSKTLNIAVSTYIRYEKREVVPREKQLEIMQDILNQQKEKQTEEYRKEFSDKARHLLMKLDLKVERFADLPEDDVDLNDLREHYGLARKDK